MKCIWLAGNIIRIVPANDFGSGCRIFFRCLLLLTWPEIKTAGAGFLRLKLSQKDRG